MPKVSVVLPSYNYENFVSETIGSVLAQSYRDWELVIVDDGSTDRSPEVIERYAKEHPGRIRVLYHEGRVNRGIVETYRLGIAQSLGEYIAFIESDDQWLPDNLEKKVAALENDPHVAVAHSRVEMFGDELAIQKLKKKYDWPRFRMAGVGASAFEALGFLLRFNFVLTFTNFMTRKIFLEDLDFSPPRGAWLDWWLLSQLSLRGKFYYVPDVCVRWRIHPKSQNFSLLSKIDDFHESFLMRDSLMGVVKGRFTRRPHETPDLMRCGIERELRRKDEGRWVELTEVGVKWVLRRYLPPIGYEYLRNIFVNRQNRRILARLDDTDFVRGWVFRSDQRPVPLVELYSGWQMLAGANPDAFRKDAALKYPDIPAASQSGFSVKLLPEWSTRPKIFYLVAWQSGGRWRKIAEKRLVPANGWSEKIRDLASFLLFIKEVHKRKLTVKPFRRSAPHFKILVSGLSKSGTTGLYYKIKNSLHDTARCLFEPKEFVPEPQDVARPVLAKILIAGVSEPDTRSFQDFERKIWIVRDPRDRVVSSTLYSLYHASFKNDTIKRDQFLELLRQKEREPRSVSLIQIIRLRAQLNGVSTDSWLGFLEKRYRRGVDYHSDHPDHFVLRYEDFVDGRLESLERYLGFKLHGKADVEPKLRRVVRTKSYGDWKNWLLNDDIEIFKPIFSDWIRLYGYDDEWAPSSSPSIDPKYGSKYVESLFAETHFRKEEKTAL